MSSFVHKYRYLFIVSAVVILTGITILFWMHKTVNISIDGQAQEITTYAINVAGFLRSQNIALSPEDKLTPAQNAWLKDGQTVTIVRSVPVQVMADGKITSMVSPERSPTSLLSQAGITLLPGDSLLTNGRPIDQNQTFPLAVLTISLQVLRAASFTLTVDGQDQVIKSTAPTLGAALWTAGYKMFDADQLTPPADTPLTPGLKVELVHSRPVTIQTQFGEVFIRTSAGTVSEALLAAHLSPQGLDYSLPSSLEPIPADHIIRLVHVTEQVLTEQTPIPFETEFQPVSDLDLDSQSVIQAGEAGVSAQRVRVRFEDGQEASRQTDSSWVAREPQPRIIGYGTNVVMHTTTVDGVTIQYWRSITMYATSYHPSEVGDTTASGMPLKKGVVAIDRSIVPFYTQLYIPGYGNAVAADIGGGVVGRMIDLGYSDDDYVSWHSWVTVYFLWPPPDNIVWMIP
jgi:resuscitation-promoting factor RpfB